jgi:hypothetical protein
VEYVVLKGEKSKEDCMTNEFVRMGAWNWQCKLQRAFNKKWELGIDNANCKELLTRNGSLELTMQIAKSF